MSKKIEWEEKYSVGVEEIDNQHKKMFAAINELLDSLEASNTNEHIENIIKSLVEYKMFHFATEEKYFKEFNYDGAEDHIAKHHEFNEKLKALQEKYPVYEPAFAYELIDFLEDWLIDHLMVVDQQYVKCFHDHGLK